MLFFLFPFVMEKDGKLVLTRKNDFDQHPFSDQNTQHIWASPVMLSSENLIQNKFLAGDID